MAKGFDIGGLLGQAQVGTDADEPVRVVQVVERDAPRRMQDLEREAAAVVARNASQDAQRFRVHSVIERVSQRAAAEFRER